jgi:hypothetical protein
MGGRGFKTIPLKFQSFDIAEPNTQFSGKYFHNNPIKIQFPAIFKLSTTPDYWATTPKSPFTLPPVLN